MTWQAGRIDDEQVKQVLRAHGVGIAYLFGSRAEARARPDSDHDVAVLFTVQPGFGATGVLADALRPVLGTDVDVVDLSSATIELRGRVANTGLRLLSDDEPRRVAFEVDARNRWIDFRPMLEATTRGYLDRVAAEGLR